MRIATSLISLDQAKANLAMEVPRAARSTTVTAAAQDAWDAVLGRVEVEGASADQLDDALLEPLPAVPLPELGLREHRHGGGTSLPVRESRAARWPSTPTRTGAAIVDGKVYVNNGFWDTYRTAWPAYSLLTPDTAAELVDGFAQQYA